MSQLPNRGSSNFTSLVTITILLIITFALIGFVALSVLTGNSFGLGGDVPQAYPTPDSTAAAEPFGTPDPQAMVSFKDTALGFNLQYPRTWRKKEQGLHVILSPSAGGLDPENLEDAAIWFGIPTDNTIEPADLLTQLQAGLSATSQTEKRGTQTIGAEKWRLAQISFEDQQLGPTTATIATTSKNEVGYYVIAIAPTEQWNALQPAFASIMNSFRFTEEAVFRPTDATPPPTPTPTPTPVFYIVKSGDTLSHVSVQYDVSIQAIMDRNGLDQTSIIRPGDKLLIPIARQRY
jgi:LysM repeat protein